MLRAAAIRGPDDRGVARELPGGVVERNPAIQHRRRAEDILAADHGRLDRSPIALGNVPMMTLTRASVLAIASLIARGWASPLYFVHQHRCMADTAGELNNLTDQRVRG
jgi:hypothetical protein